MSEPPSESARLQTLEAQARLNEAADETLELALRDRLALDATLRSMLPLLAAHTGAAAVWLRTYDEELRMRDFRYGPEITGDMEDVWRATSDGNRVQRQQGELFLVGQPLDVAGEIFGAASLVFTEAIDPRRCGLAADLLNTWCEELDNYLAPIARARRKAQTMRALSEALRAPVLEEGITKALEVLREAVPYDDLLLALRHHSDRAGTSLHYKIVQNGALTHDSSRPDMEVDDFIRGHAGRLIQGESRALVERFGLERSREEVLISGLQNAHVIGRLCVTSKSGEFNTYDRDILERFADYLRQRVVDFNREWHTLRLTFPAPVARRLLDDADYAERHLSPRVEEVAVLFADISGFTRISEQVLKEPRRIGELIDGWSRRVVEIVWETGGCFDKMVGDCIIGLWGPPFHEMSADEACWGAAAAAHRIRALTAEYNTGKILPELKDLDPPIGVATGLGYAPLCVGRFGPNEDFTGFSSGMNNVARLQGVASCDEILCSEAFVSALGEKEGTRFGPELHAEVKNVAEPLRYRKLERGPE
ncbi:MAG: adenylate/guanylate cyclase domain-containing protein [Myxococcota bacterium]